MTISEAVRDFLSHKNSEDEQLRAMADELVIRRKGWRHGRVLIPGKFDLYVTTIGKYPMMPTPIELDTDEIVAEDWYITTRAEMLAPPPRTEPGGRRKLVAA